jgi:hypothetical protein
MGAVHRLRSNVTRGIYGGAVVGALLTALPTIARANEDDRLATIALPGRPDALARAAGLNSPVEASRLLSEVVRAHYGLAQATDVPRQRTQAYLRSLDAIRRAWATAGVNGVVSLPSGASPSKQLIGLIQALGCRLTSEGGRWRVNLIVDEPQRALLADAGLDVNGIARRLEAGEAVPWPLPQTSVPSPLDAAAWMALIGNPRLDSAGTVEAILTDRNLALLHYGLLHAGAGALAAARSSPELLRVIHRHAARFAAFGSSVAIVDGHVVTPGGAAMVAAWEAFVGQPTGEPERFVSALFERDGGRLAWFYESIARLDPPVIHFVAGGAGATVDRQTESLRSVYRTAARVMEEFTSIDRAPLSRPALDPSLVLLQMRATPDGRFRSPRSRAFWEAAFESEESDGTIRLDHRDDVDATFLLTRVFAPVRQHRYDRADAMAFAQRVFAETPEEHLGEAALALRGFGRYRALLLTLERLDVRDARTYAAAVRLAGRMGEVRDPLRGRVLQAQFQGGLALLERLRLVRRLSAPDTQALITSLLTVEIAQDHRFYGGVAHWLDTALLPHLKLTALGDETPILEALAGVVPPDDPTYPERVPELTWLDLPYRLDLAASTLQRLVRVRARQGGNTLATALALARTSRSLEQDAKPDESRAIAAIEDLMGRLMDPEVPGRPNERPWKIQPTLRWALDELRRNRSRPELSRVRDVAVTLLAACDVVLADVLMSLAYAPHLGDPDGPLMLGGDVSQRHDFGFDINDRDTRLHAAWSMPEAPTGYGLTWQVWGSLLGLDVGLSGLLLPQTTVGTPQAGQSVTESGRKALLQGLALLNPYDLRDDETREIAARLRNGRETAARVFQERHSLSSLSETARLEPNRTRTLEWIHAQDPERLDTFLSVPELLRLASQRGPEDGWAGRLGAPLVAWDGSLRQGWVPAATALARGTFADAPHLVAGFPDLLLRLAEVTAELRLPAAVIGPLARIIVAEFLDQLRAGHPDDPTAWSDYAAAVSWLRIEAAVSSLTTEGLLRPETSR